MKKRSAKKPSPSPSRVKQASKTAYLKRRKKRVRELYVNEHLEPRDIAARLVADGTIETTDESLESAIRLVRGDVADIRAELTGHRTGDADSSLAFTEIDALELELKDLRRERDRQLVIAAGELRMMCARTLMPLEACVAPECTAIGKHAPYEAPAVGITKTETPQGPMISYKALWPAGVRQKASKDAATLTEKISKLEVALVEKRRATLPRPAATAAGEQQKENFFEIVTSGRSMNELISSNASGGEESKPN